ncbi:MAG TPA: VOC family protein [Candidatus Dormibacteraeota bacterium]|nr:VOC family protein [Candidatus Dormibacteraeota bacterium]
MAHGEINHIEFPADDTDRAKAFYGAVAGWEFGEMPEFPDYHLFRTAEGYGGAIGKRDVSTGHILRIYIEVDSMDDALAAATRTGGTIKEPKQEITGMGWFAVVIDPEGSEVGLFQSSRAS